MKKDKIMIIVCLAVLLIGLTTYTMYYKNEAEVNYIINYSDDYTPGNTYKMIFYKDKVKIEKQPGCSTVDCLNGTYYPDKEEYEVDIIGKEKYVDELIQDIFIDKKTEVDIDRIEINKRDIQIIEAIIYNTEDIWNELM